MCITLCLSLNFCLPFYSSKCCTLGIRRFFSNCFLLTVVSAILSNVILSKIIIIFPFTPVPDLFLSIVNKQIPILDLCGTPQMTLIHLRSDSFFPILFFIGLFTLALPALIVSEHLSFFRSWGTLSSVFWKLQVTVINQTFDSFRGMQWFERSNNFWKQKLYFPTVCLSYPCVHWVPSASCFSAS